MSTTFLTKLTGQVKETGLSKGQIAGIVIGAVTGVVLIFVGGYRIGLWRAKNRVIYPPRTENVVGPIISIPDPNSSFHDKR